ncbi:MAG: transposase [Chloroflexi bacterium]|nr:transposase [Chloroflexota bacterium]
MQKLPALQFGKYYHIYNRGINRENIFFEARNYVYFLALYVKYIETIADTFAYCLMRNHFHLLVRIIETFEVSQTSKVCDPTQQFSNLFNAYAKAINKAYGRTGSLFEGRFGRIEVTSAEYFKNLIVYIHRNPQKHGFVEDFREYPYSSYATILADKPTRLKRDAVVKWFRSQDAVRACHQSEPDTRAIRYLVEDDVFDA